MARNSLPQALKEVFQMADKPPPLNNLQVFLKNKFNVFKVP